MKFQKQIPNILTIARIILILPFFYFLNQENFLISFFLICFIFISDFLDGYLARKYKLESNFGAILDPTADKLVSIAFFTYFFLKSEFVPIYYFFLSFSRDFLQLCAIPILLYYKKMAFKVKPKFIPKYGTAVKFILLIFLFFQNFEFLKDFILKIEILYQILLFSSLLSEIYILVTFLPRFIQIYLGKHDTFE